MVVLFAGLVGCGPSEQPETGLGLPAALPGPQERVFADGVVTFSEYESAVFAFSDCMAGAEHPLVNLAIGRNLRIYQFQYGESAVSDGSFETCYTRELEFVDEQWQTVGALKEVSGGEMRDRTLRCLKDLGYVPPDHDIEIGRAIRGALDAGFDALSC